MRTSKRATRRTCWAWTPFALMSALLLTSCGGGSGLLAGGVGSGGTGIVVGTVVGFGSVVVDGTTYSSETPEYFSGNDKVDADAAPATAVELGDQLEVQRDAQGNPSTVVIEPALIGPVANLTASGFAVNGVPVQVNTNLTAGPLTYYAGLPGFAGLSNLMQVQVHGVYGMDASGQGYIQATLIEQLRAINPVIRITGLVSNWNPVAGNFRIGNMTIQLGSSTSMLPVGMALANGQLVNVWSNTPVSNGVLSAVVIRIRTLQGVVEAAQIGGLVAMLSGSSFQVSGIPVNAGAAGLATTVRSLVPGEYVVVNGQVDAASGVLSASSIRTYASQPAQVELSGAITDFVDQSNFLVRGALVNAFSAQFQGGAATSLGNGVFVDVVGSAGGNVIIASTVTVSATAPDGATVDYDGTVSQVNVNSGTFVLTWQQGGATVSADVTLDPNVVYSDGTVSQLVDGAAVEIEATNTSGAGLRAYSVAFLPAGIVGGSALDTQGIVYGLDSTNTSFTVNGLTIQVNGVTPQGGTLADGAFVEVSFTQSAGQNLAQEINVVK